GGGWRRHPCDPLPGPVPVPCPGNDPWRETVAWPVAAGSSMPPGRDCREPATRSGLPHADVDANVPCRVASLGLQQRDVFRLVRIAEPFPKLRPATHLVRAWDAVIAQPVLATTLP